MPRDAVNNRRRRRRQPAQLRIDLLPVANEVGELQLGSARSGVTLDLNETGVLCSRVGYLPLGGVVRAFLRLPDVPEEPLACYARVVRCDLNTNSPGYGLKFLDLPQAAALRLARFSQQRQAAAPSWMYRFAS